MELNPKNIAEKEFELEEEGYSKTQVTKFLNSLSQEFDNLTTESSILKQDFSGLKEKLEEYKTKEKELREKITSAKEKEQNASAETQKKALNILKEAENKAQEIINRAEEEAKSTRDTLLFLKEQREIMLVRLKVIINNQERILSDLEKEDTSEELKKAMLEAAAFNTESEINIEKIMEKLL